MEIFLSSFHGMQCGSTVFSMHCFVTNFITNRTTGEAITNQSCQSRSATRIISVLAVHKGQAMKEFSVNCITGGGTEVKSCYPRNVVEEKYTQKWNTCNLSLFPGKGAMKSCRVIDEFAVRSNKKFNRELQAQPN